MISPRRSLLRKYSYSDRRSSVDPLRNTPWKRSLVSARLGSARRALRAVSVNCYVRTRPSRVALDVHTRRRSGGVGDILTAHLAKRAPRRGESDRGKIAARKPHVAEESGGENDVSCTCELCIGRDYHAKNCGEEKSETREDVRPKGSCRIT